MELQVSKIKNTRLAIPAEQRIKIYELAKDKNFQHPLFLYYRKTIKTLRNRGNPSGRDNRKKVRTKRIKVTNYRAGQPYYKKIANEVGISYMVVSWYLNQKHEIYREKNKIKPRTKEQIARNTYCVIKCQTRNDENFNSLDKDNQLKLMNKLAKGLLEDDGAWKLIRIKLHQRCKKCNMIISRRRHFKIFQDLCTHCSHSKSSSLAMETRNQS